MHHDTIRIVTLDHRVDSTHDSVYVYNNTYAKNDTVFVEKNKWSTRLQYRDRIRTDTVYRAKTDTITIVQTVSKPITKVQSILISLGRIFAMLLLVVFVVGGIMLAGKIKK